VNAVDIFQIPTNARLYTKIFFLRQTAAFRQTLRDGQVPNFEEQVFRLSSPQLRYLQTLFNRKHLALREIWRQDEL